MASGDLLAVMGQSGNAAGGYDHCHFEARATAAGKGLEMCIRDRPDVEVVKLPVTGDTASDFEGAATLEQDAALTLTVRYYLDNVLIDSFTPAQRLVRGAHALALFYPFPDLEGAASHRWSVRLLCAGGGVKIAKGQIRATITEMCIRDRRMTNLTRKGAKHEN